MKKVFLICSIFIFMVKTVSAKNSFAAETLDLTVDGEDTNVVKFTVSNFLPGDQKSGIYTLANEGTINGYLNLENINVNNNENGCSKWEIKLGDTTCDNPGLSQGELDQLVNLKLFVDYDCDKQAGVKDKLFYDGAVVGLAKSYNLNEPLNTGSTLCLSAIFDWEKGKNDSLAQGDSYSLDLTFRLDQVLAVLPTPSLLLDSTSMPTTHAEGKVLGSVTNLPQTGSGFTFFALVNFIAGLTLKVFSWYGRRR